MVAVGSSVHRVIGSLKKESKTANSGLPQRRQISSSPKEKSVKSFTGSNYGNFGIYGNYGNRAGSAFSAKRFSAQLLEYNNLYSTAFLMIA